MANTIAIAFLGPVDRGTGVFVRFLAFAEARGCIAFTPSVEMTRCGSRVDSGANRTTAYQSRRTAISFDACCLNSLAAFSIASPRLAASTRRGGFAVAAMKISQRAGDGGGSCQ